MARAVFYVFALLVLEALLNGSNAFIYPSEKVFKITCMSGELRELDDETGREFTLTYDDYIGICGQTDAGEKDPAKFTPVAKCQVDKSNGDTIYMYLIRIVGTRKTIYVKDRTGRKDYEIYEEGGPAPPKKKGLFSFLSSKKSNASVAPSDK